MKTLCKECDVLALYCFADITLQNVQRSKYGWHQFGTLIPHIFWLNFSLVPLNSNSIWPMWRVP